MKQFLSARFTYSSKRQFYNLSFLNVNNSSCWPSDDILLFFCAPWYQNDLFMFKINTKIGPKYWSCHWQSVIPWVVDSPKSLPRNKHNYILNHWLTHLLFVPIYISWYSLLSFIFHVEHNRMVMMIWVTVVWTVCKYIQVWIQIYLFIVLTN